MSRSTHRPYLYTSYVCGCGGLLYVTLKACLYSYPVAWLPPAAIMVTFATFSWLHILAARWVRHTAGHTRCGTFLEQTWGQRRIELMLWTLPVSV